VYLFKLVIVLCHKCYVERLGILDLSTLKFRRITADVIEAYKVLSGVYMTQLSHPEYL